MGYYDIDDILADGHKIPCTFEQTVPGVGYLADSSTSSSTTISHSHDIKAGTRLALPLWLAEMIACSQQLGPLSNTLSLDLPPALSARVQNALVADARSVDIRALGASHFYKLAERMLGLFEEDQLAGVLVEAFKARAAEIADIAQNPHGAAVGDEGDVFYRGLDDNELKLYNAAHQSAKAMRQYMVERGIKK